MSDSLLSNYNKETKPMTSNIKTPRGPKNPYSVSSKCSGLLYLSLKDSQAALLQEKNHLEAKSIAKFATERQNKKYEKVKIKHPTPYFSHYSTGDGVSNEQGSIESLNENVKHLEELQGTVRLLTEQLQTSNSSTERIDRGDKTKNILVNKLNCENFDTQNELSSSTDVRFPLIAPNQDSSSPICTRSSLSIVKSDKDFKNNYMYEASKGIRNLQNRIEESISNLFQDENLDDSLQIKRKISVPKELQMYLSSEIFNVRKTSEQYFELLDKLNHQKTEMIGMLHSWKNCLQRYSEISDRISNVIETESEMSLKSLFDSENHTICNSHVSKHSGECKEIFNQIDDKEIQSNFTPSTKLKKIKPISTQSSMVDLPAFYTTRETQTDLKDSDSKRYRRMVRQIDQVLKNYSSLISNTLRTVSSTSTTNKLSLPLPQPLSMKPVACVHCNQIGSLCARKMQACRGVNLAKVHKKCDERRYGSSFRHISNGKFGTRASKMSCRDITEPSYNGIVTPISNACLLHMRSAEIKTIDCETKEKTTIEQKVKNECKALHLPTTSSCPCSKWTGCLCF